MTTVTVDVPAFSVDDDAHSIAGSSNLSSRDTGTELVLDQSAQPLAIDHYGAGSSGPPYINLPEPPDGGTLTNATYVVIAYAESSEGSAGSHSSSLAELTSDVITISQGDTDTIPITPGGSLSYRTLLDTTLSPRFVTADPTFTLQGFWEYNISTSGSVAVAICSPDLSQVWYSAVSYSYPTTSGPLVSGPPAGWHGQFSDPTTSIVDLLAAGARIIIWASVDSSWVVGPLGEGPNTVDFHLDSLTLSTSQTIDWSPDTPDPTQAPFLMIETSATGVNFTLDPIPVGAYAGETVWAGNDLAGITGDIPANRIWLQSFADVPIHVAYAAVRLTYTVPDPTGTISGAPGPARTRFVY